MTVNALLKFEGVDGTQVFTDETGNQTWAASGSGTIAELDDAEFKAGSSALKVDQDHHVLGTIAADLSGAFTIEGWYYVDNAATGNVVLFEFNLPGPSYFWQVYLNTSNGEVSAYSSYYGSFSAGTLDSTGKGVWFHCSLSRMDSGIFIGQVNGALGGTAPNTTATQGDIVDVKIGGELKGYNNGMTGWVDGFRVSDEWIYQSGQASAVPDDPGLTYTIETIQHRDMEFPLIARSQQVQAVFDGSDLGAVCRLMDLVPKENASECGSGIQIWG